MAKVAIQPVSFESKLLQTLRKGLNSAGIKAKVELEQIPGTKLRRVYVVSSTFDKLRHSERQELVWRIVGFKFTPDEQLKISMILTLSPKEMRGR